MNFLMLPFSYFYWHYGRGVLDLLTILGNLIRFTVNFFSLPTAAQTLFSPWRRMGEPYPEHFDPTVWLTALIVNTMMRVVGVLMRLVLIVIGILSVLVTIILALIMVIVWLLLPLLVVTLAVLGLYFLLSD